MFVFGDLYQTHHYILDEDLNPIELPNGVSYLEAVDETIEELKAVEVRSFDTTGCQIYELVGLFVEA